MNTIVTTYPAARWSITLLADRDISQADLDHIVNVLDTIAIESKVQGLLEYLIEKSNLPLVVELEEN